MKVDSIILVTLVNLLNSTPVKVRLNTAMNIKLSFSKTFVVAQRLTKKSHRDSRKKAQRYTKFFNLLCISACSLCLFVEFCCFKITQRLAKKKHRDTRSFLIFCVSLRILCVSLRNFTVSFNWCKLTWFVKKTL